MSTPVTNETAAARPRKSLRVLYAEDMRELRQLLQVVLGRDGHKVESVSDGNLALELILPDPAAYDVVITDHHMATMSGLELVARLRALAYSGKIIVFSSELSEKVDASYRAQDRKSTRLNSSHQIISYAVFC